MSEFLVTDAEFTALADTIRTKGGTSDTLSWPDGFTNAIDTLKTEDFLEARLARTLTEYTNEKLTSIADYGFYYYGNLKSVDLPAVERVGSYAFYNCAGLTNVNFPAMTEVGSYGFSKSGISNLSLPELIRANVQMASYCTNLETLDVPKCTDLGQQACMGCTKLTTVTAPLITKVTNAFNSCTALASISLPSVTRIETYGFYGCTSLESVDLPLLTYVGQQSFASCASLTNISFPKATKVEYSAFDQCAALTNVSLPLVTSLADRIFSNCTSLVGVTLGSEGNAITSIPSYIFMNDMQEGLEITVYTTNGSADDLTGAPWGATNATVTYLQA